MTPSSMSSRASVLLLCSLSAAELDSTLTGKVPLLVDRLDGQPLTARDGPWRVFVPGDRRPARWVRQVVRLHLASAP